MTGHRRRTVLRTVGAVAVGGALGTGITGGEPGDQPDKGSLRKLGHSLLSDPDGGYAEEDVRADGRYAVLGSFFGEGGSFLVDVSDPTEPTEVHRVPSDPAVRNADVAFDPRDGLYYRSQEPNTGDADLAGVEVVDYGFEQGTPEDPEIVASLDAGGTHNVYPHPEEPVLYATNHFDDNPERGNTAVEVWDVSDPTEPRQVDQPDDAPVGNCHDMVLDPERELLHGAFIGDPGKEYFNDGYLVYDASDPREPTELGRFDYADRPDYSEERLENGEPGYENGHYANYDPERGVAVVGDEIATGAPGGKHVFDVGWGDGSPSDPRHVGFTYSPNAELMDEGDELFDWTGHNFQVVPKGSTTLLVSGDYHEGAVVYDISDPTDPVPTDRYETDDDADEANEPILPLGSAPMAWGADYAAARDLVVTSDMFTGVYTFKATPDASGTRGGGR